MTTPSIYIEALRHALWVLLLAAGVPLCAAALAGAAGDALLRWIGVRDQTVVLLLRLVAGLGALLLCAPWIGAQLVQLTTALLGALPQLGR